MQIWTTTLGAPDDVIQRLADAASQTVRCFLCKGDESRSDAIGGTWVDGKPICPLCSQVYSYSISRDEAEHPDAVDRARDGELFRDFVARKQREHGMVQEITLPERMVICDLCNANHTDTDDVGGVLLGGKAVCPACAAKYADAIAIDEAEHPEMVRHAGESEKFGDFVRAIRGPGNGIRITSF